jgi:transposase
VEQRYQAVLAVIRDGVPIVQVARRFDVSRQAVHRWLRWYEDQGLGGLADRSHRPPRCSHQMDPAVEVWVLEARRRHPEWGPRRLVHEASMAGVEPPPSRSGIYRALKRSGLIDPQTRRRRDRRFHRWERGGAMELWQMDVVGGVLLADGRDVKVLTGIDDHSRFVVCSGLMLRATSRAVCRHFAQALRPTVFPRRSSPTTARSSRAGSAAPKPRCCSTGSAGRTGSITCSPPPGARRRPARSSGSTGRSARSSSPDAPSPIWGPPRPSSIAGSRAITASGRIRPWTWPHRPAVRRGRCGTSGRRLGAARRAVGR